MTKAATKPKTKAASKSAPTVTPKAASKAPPARAKATPVKASKAAKFELKLLTKKLKAGDIAARTDKGGLVKFLFRVDLKIMMAEGVSGEIRLCLDVSQYMPDGYALTLTDYGVHTANAKTLTLLVVGRLTENHQGEKPPSPAAAVPPPPPSTETPPGLTVTGFAPAPDVPLDPPAVAQAGKPHVAVPAAARPADKTHVCHFDAAPWFAAATPDGIVALAERRWKGVDAGEFNVVTWCVQYDPAVAAMVTAHTNATTAELAFTVDADAAMDWIEANGDNTLLNRVIQANMANAGEPEDR